MNSVLIFLRLSFIVSLLFASQSTAQWWVDGGNLIWPYGDVTINEKLNLSDSLIFENEGKAVNFHLYSFDEEGTIVYEPQLEILTTQSGSNDFGRLQMSSQSLNYFGSSANASFSVGSNGRLIVNDLASGFTVALAPLQKAIQLNNAVYVMTGTGSPEGLVSAPRGSLYLRSDGGSGTSLYVKESGVSTSGWIAK